MEIEIIRNNNIELWSNNLNDFDYSMFISPLWIESLIQNNRYSVYLDFYYNGELTAKIGGVFFDNKYSFQKKLIFYAGPALKKHKSETLIDQCLLSLIDYASENKFCRLVLLSYDYKHISSLQKKYKLQNRSEFLINLTQEKGQIIANMSRNFLHNTKKAIKKNYLIKESNSPEMIDTLLYLLQQTKSVRLSKMYSDYDFFYFPGFSRTTLEYLVKHNAICFYYVEKDSKIYAIEAVLQHNNRAYGLLIGVDAEAYEHGVATFINYSVILLLQGKNYEYINLGGIPTEKSHKGLVTFKLRTGAKEQLSTYGSINLLAFPLSLIYPASRIFQRIVYNSLTKYIKIKIMLLLKLK